MADDCCCCIDLEIDEPSLMWGEDEYVRVVNANAEEYAGPYEATPTSETQVFPTTARLMARDFIVNPIPSNYGLIEWNGSVLRVS